MKRHQLHIHVAGRSITMPVRDGVTNRSTAVMELVARLLAAVERLNSSTHDDGQEGHPFYGNQYTDVVLGPKPTETKAKGSKAAVHELLTSGHHFTLEELMAASGAKNLSTLTTAISDLKNPKYAGPTGALQIIKHKSGHYSLAKSDGTPLAVPKAASTASAPKPDPTPPASTAQPPSSWVAKAPATKMTKSEADKQYEETMTALHASAADIASDPTGSFKKAAKHWKEGKAKAMTQWAANVKGTDQKLKPVEVFKEDEDLVYKLALAHESKPELVQQKVAAALAEWKEATAKAKTAPKPAPPTPKAPDPHKPGPVTSVPVPHPPSGGHTLPAPDSIAPHDYEGVKAADFKTGHFAKEMLKFKKVLADKGTDSSGNKAKVQQALEARLFHSPHFNDIEKQYKKALPGNSLVSSMIQAWAGSSGDHHDKSCALQLAARDAFKMDPAHVEMVQLGAIKPGKEDDTYHAAAKHWKVSTGSTEQLNSFKAALKDFVLAQYHETQSLLKKHGVEHVYLARGMKVQAENKAQKVKLKLQPASSFSTNLSTAKMFSGGHTVFFSKVPASQVLSTYHTGFGCTSEHEVVVLSHPSTTAVQVPNSHTEVSVHETIKSIATKVTKWD